MNKENKGDIKGGVLGLVEDGLRPDVDATKDVDDDDDDDEVEELAGAPPVAVDEDDEDDEGEGDGEDGEERPLSGSGVVGRYGVVFGICDIPTSLVPAMFGKILPLTSVFTPP